jgi:ribonuclease HI
LAPKDQARVDTANKIYQFAASVILLCNELGKDWTLEQPHRSLFWRTKYWRSVEQHLNPVYVKFDHCMYKGSRPKRTMVAGSFVGLKGLETFCDGQHAHLPWGRTPHGFATAEEVQYPLDLCRAWAAIVAEHIKETWPGLAKVTQLASPDRAAAVLALKQTRRSPVFMADYDGVQAVKVFQEPPFRAGEKLAQTITIHSGGNEAQFPAGARVLSVRKTAATFSNKGGQGDGSSSSCSSSGGSGVWTVRFGSPWTEEGFMEEAVRRGHPLHIFEGISQDMRLAIQQCARVDPCVTAMQRAAFLKKWTNKALELLPKEKELAASLSPPRRCILQGKRLVLLDCMLRECGYTDPEIAFDIAKGFDLVGLSPKSGALPDAFQPAQLSEADLLCQAPAANKSIFFSTKSCGNPDIDAELWRKTCQEKEAGWLQGPVPFQEIVSDGRLTRRFPVQQSGKVRRVDNFSESQINDAVTLQNRVTVDGTDTVAAMCAETMRTLKAEGKNTKLMGRSFDLTSAYKQLAISDRSAKWSRIAVYNPHTKQTECFIQYCLPFGARASVNAFIRTARMIQFLALQINIVVSCYFDDFIVLSVPEMAASTEKAFAALLELIGFAYDREGPKADSMSDQVTALGVVFDLSCSQEGFLKIRNTERRIEEVTDKIATLAGRFLTPGEAATLKGRLGFAEGQLFGRSARRLINDLGAFALASQQKSLISEELTESLRAVSKMLLGGRPREIDTRSHEVLHLYTDASFNPESGTGGIGGVLCAATGEPVAWFGEDLDKAFCDKLKGEGQTQIIGELEALAVLEALVIWSKEIKSKHVVVFVDNEGAKFAILRGYSRNPRLSRIVAAIADAEEGAMCFCWYSRVPSEGNPADSPSRGVPCKCASQDMRVTVDIQKLEAVFA